MMNTRRTASFIVARWLATHEFPGALLPKEGPDRGFVQDMVYAVIRRHRVLRSVLGRLLKTWPNGELEALLLVGAAQILYMPDVPDFAAVSETVSAAKKSGAGRRFDRVVNGVLRNLIRRREELMAQVASAPLAVRESFPDALVKRWCLRYGAEKAEAMAKLFNTPAETWLSYSDGRMERLPRGRRVDEAEGYADGAFLVQDPATLGAVELLDVRPGQTVLDFCAAPGGKTAQIAWRLRPTTASGQDGASAGGRLVAQEVNPVRLERLRENMKRLRMDWVETAQSLSAAGDVPKAFDRVLLDVPCSNTGVLRRRPDARWRWSVVRLRQLTQVQSEILEKASALVAPGGRLVYSTCSLEPEENAERIGAFLAAHPEFRQAEVRESLPFETGNDGAFACALVRARDC